MESLFSDIRYAVRSLLKRPGFTAIAIVTLALGIGANTAIFSVVNALLLRPLPFKEPDKLVQVWEANPKLGRDTITVSYPNFADWRDQNQVFEQIAAYSDRTFNLTGTTKTRSLNRLPLIQIEPSISLAVLSPSEFRARLFRPLFSLCWESSPSSGACYCRKKTIRTKSSRW